MAADRRRSRSGGGERMRPAQGGRSERPFDVWLNRQLHTMYDDIAREPIPREVIELIESDARESGRRGEADEAAGTDELLQPPAGSENKQG